ncbi:hypothetical protein N7492_000271 [Penicillium capsulatum]|uniref:Uncharacterized protein n=1 Tax=Penicillium capsulatum TaxID=69766 RepID=A0A9W9IT77_9EURO|nr:hypothetical protein N7492_000271 [Penicillium capsulatum]KAJ6130663.1 hypothetical protein N7512_003443 [Penicillium capsulatum]
MDTAPLTLAHTHARNAVLETRKSNPVAASEEHDLAAGEFATAASNSSDKEALRTLQLLENHHKQLAEILRFQHEHPASSTADAPVTPTPNTVAQPSTDAGNTASTAPTLDSQGQPPRLAVPRPRLPSRESSNITNTLASARGIRSDSRRGSPASPTLSSQHARAKMTDAPSRTKTGDSRPRNESTKHRSSRAPTAKQPWSPPLPSATEVTSQDVVPAETVESTDEQTQPTADEPFQRFYSTFEGLISRISAPLAFAGLPLGLEDPSKASSRNRKSPAYTKVDRHHAMPDRKGPPAEPDVSQIFSQAALRSIRDTPGAGPGNPAESFYVVPTTGGTMSYAGILTRAEKEHRRTSLDEGDDDFVDARETPSSPEMRQSTASVKRAGRRNATDKPTNLHNLKTLEELQMENNALKQLSDTLSKRLHMWEVNAQSSSMALQQSLRAMHHQNTGSPDHLPQGSSLSNSPVATLTTPTPADSDQRVKELEEIVRRGEKQMASMNRENDKLRNVLDRYRDRWEKLKSGAKTRREGRSNDGQNLASKSPNSPGSPYPNADPASKFPPRDGVGLEAESKTDTPTT